MAISALSGATVRLLGSHTVINTPVDLVKELLDNAIDAKATSVDILASPNFVDNIEVRDNGHGIRLDDYDSLGRAGHTSKITSFEDLRTLGGTTLGFRGQALASANNLGTVTVTTRTAEDPSAVELRLFPGVGGVEGQRQTSAPIGTTVSVANLYSRLPVREQVAVNNALKSLAKTKQLLHSYALARPQLRLSFRLTGRSNKQPFSYSPRAGACVKEAAIQIFGTELASQCLIRTICSDADDEDGGVIEDNEKFSIEAVLPKPDADQSRISKGPFFSVDSRPVSAQQGTMKKLLVTFKEHFSRYLDLTYGEKPLRNSFVCVNIRSSPGSYDSNIEPSKDIVLFTDDSKLTRSFERLCSEVYSIQETPNPIIKIGKGRLHQRTQIRTPPASSDSAGCEEPTPAAPNKVANNLITHLQETSLPNSSSPVCELPERFVPQRLPAPATFGGRAFTVDMSTDPDISSDEESEMIASRFRQQEKDLQVDGEDEDPKAALNPWTIAKMNAPARQTVHTQTLSIQNPQSAGKPQEQPKFAMLNEVFENLPVSRPYGEAPADLAAPFTTRIDDTSTIHQGPKLPDFRYPFKHGTITDIANHDALQPLPQTNEINEGQALPGLWSSTSLKTTKKFPDDGTRNVEIDGVVQTGLTCKARHNDPQAKRKGQMKRRINAISSRTNPPFHKPKRVSNRDRYPSALDHQHSHDHVADWVKNRRLMENELGSMRYQSTPQLPDPPAPGSGSIGVSTLHIDPPSSETWVDGDPRKYLMKRQRSEVEHRRSGRQSLKRVKTDRLPLETVTESQGIQHLVLTVHSDAKKLAENLEGTVGNDTFSNNCHIDTSLGDDMALDDVAEVEAKLECLLSAWTEKVLGQRAEVNLDLRSQVKGKAVAA